MTELNLTTSPTFAIHLKITVLFKPKLETCALCAMAGGSKQQGFHRSPRDQTPFPFIKNQEL